MLMDFDPFYDIFTANSDIFIMCMCTMSTSGNNNSNIFVRDTRSINFADNYRQKLSCANKSCNITDDDSNLITFPDNFLQRLAGNWTAHSGQSCSSDILQYICLVAMYIIQYFFFR